MTERILVRVAAVIAAPDDFALVNNDAANGYLAQGCGFFCLRVRSDSREIVPFSFSASRRNEHSCLFDSRVGCDFLSCSGACGNQSAYTPGPFQTKGFVIFMHFICKNLHLT